MTEQQIIDDFLKHYRAQDAIDRHRMRTHVLGLTKLSNKQSRRRWSSLLARIDEVEGGAK